MQSAPVNFHKRSRLRRILRSKTLLIVVLAFVVVFGTPLMLARTNALALYRAASDGKASFEAVKTAVANENFALASTHARAAQEDFAEAHRLFGGISFLRFFPLFTRQVNAVGHLVAVGEHASGAAVALLDAADEVLAPLSGTTVTFASVTKEQKHDMLAALEEAHPRITDASAELTLAAEELERIPSHALLPQLQDAAQLLREQIPTVAQQLHDALPLLSAAPTFLGYPEERRYLFLLQNNHELRPTGGFIGTYGILDLEDAEIRSFVTDNVYNLDSAAADRLTLKAPAPLQKYLNQSTWFLRDGNWSPDFPTAAQQVLSMYDTEKGSPQHLDGVLAVTPTVLESLLGITGPLTVDGTEFSAENVVAYLEYQVEVGYSQDGIAESDRKNIIGDLADVLFHRLLTLPKERWPDLVTTLGASLDQKQFLLSVHDEDVQAQIDARGWNGEVRETDGDYFLIVDANLASLKTDQHVVRQVTYSLRPEDGTLRATLSMHYNNTGGFDWQSTRYRTFVRTYVPLGSTLISSSGFLSNDKLHNGKPETVAVSEELGKTVFSGFTSIEPGEEGTTAIEYTLPNELYEAFASGRYELLAQKQAGTKGNGLTLDIDTGGRVESYTPSEGVTISSGAYQAATTLETDRSFTLTFRP